MRVLTDWVQARDYTLEQAEISEDDDLRADKSDSREAFTKYGCATNPWMALFHFSLALDRESVDPSISFSQAGYDAFYRLPLNAPIRLFAPMEPAPVMHFTPDGVSR